MPRSSPLHAERVRLMAEAAAQGELRDRAKVAAKPRHSAYPRPLVIPQAMIRRGAEAMREHWSNDTYALTAIMLKAALRSANDVLEMLPPETPPVKIGRPPKQPAAEHAAA